MKLFSALLGTLLLTVLLPMFASAQQVSYNDVLLIVNDASTASVDIGSYFSTRRGIPSSHICHINTTTSETIDSVTFKSLQWQIQNYMRSNNLVNSINYIVTTKGCPLRVTTRQQDQFGLPAPIFAVYGGQASFEDLLVVINGRDSTEILAPKLNNSITWSAPYYNSSTRFARTSSLPIYLVTRLDGFTVDDVKALIRRAETPVQPGQGVYVFDKAPNRDTFYNGTWYEEPNNALLSLTTIMMRTLGDSVLLSTGPGYVHNVQNVIGYASWGTNDGSNVGGLVGSIPGNTWVNGAIAELFVSTSARTITWGQRSGQSLVGDWVAEGVSGIKGYTDEPTTGSVANVQILFDRYRTRRWNLAESFYAASPYYVWRQVLIGDPKMTLGQNIPVQQSQSSGGTLTVPTEVRLNGNTSQTSVSGVIHVTNTSTTSPITISDFTLYGAGGRYFTLGNTVPLTVAANSSYDIPVTFTASPSRKDSATLVITSNGTVNRHMVFVYGDLTGSGGGSGGSGSTAKNLTVPTAVSLNGNTSQSSVSGVIHVTNTSTAFPITISSLTLYGAGGRYFTLGTAPITVAANTSYDIPVTFTASLSRQDSATLVIVSDAVVSRQMVFLYGDLTGTTGSGGGSGGSGSTAKNLTVPTAVSLNGNTSQPSVSGVIHVTNTSTAFPITISSLTLYGAGSRYFTLGTAPITVAANTSYDIPVTFTASPSRRDSATLVISSDAVGGRHMVFVYGDLTGTGGDTTGGGVAGGGGTGGSMVSIDYSDVLVIVNDSSTASTDIGNYFATRRGIPASHIVHINTSTSETTDSATFKTLQRQIQTHMRTNNLVDSINYIVTTKGCPLRVTTTQQDNLAAGIYGGKSSFEDCLVLINGADSVYILATKGYSSPIWQSRYLNSTQRFQRTASLPWYLVTRLDGYTVEDVKAMIRRAESPVLASDGLWVLDADPGKSAQNNRFITGAAPLLTNYGLDVLLDQTSTYLRGKQNVLGYASWGSYDASSGGGSGAAPNNTWANGALAQTYSDLSARTFASGTGEALIGDLIAEGATGAKGMIDGPWYLGNYANVSVVFDRYVSGFNLAESFYAGSAYFGWRQVIIGDPKMELATQEYAWKQNGGSSTTSDASGNSLVSVTPNPFNSSTQISYAVGLDGSTVKMDLLGTLGTEVATLVDATQNRGTYSVTLNGQGLAAGNYICRMTVTSPDGNVTTVTRPIIYVR